MASIKVYTVKGIFNADKQGKSVTITPLTFQIQNGERVIVWPATMAETRFLPMAKWEKRAKK